MSTGASPDRSRVSRSAAVACAPVGSGAVTWNASLVRAPPASRAYGVTPRARACTARSRTRQTAPSPNTNPSRSRSNGRLARSGSSLRRDSGPMLDRPASMTGAIPASEPPATTTSASPESSSRCASSRAALPLAQASAPAVTGPRRPSAIATSQAAMFGITDDT